MKILFFNPPLLNNLFILAEDGCLVSHGYANVPFQLLATATMAKQQGHTVAFKDYAIEKKDWPQVLDDAENYDYVVASLGNVCESHYLPLQQVKNLIAIAVPEGYKDQLESVFHPKLVAWHDAEYVITQFLNGIAVKQPVQETHFQDIPPIDYSIYPYYWYGRKGFVSQSSRDCVYRCNFCMWGGSTLHKSQFVSRPPETMIKELTTIQSLKKPNDLVLLSTAQITTDIGWLRKFVALKQKHCPDLSIHTDIGIGEIDEECAQLLSKCNIEDCVVGVEAFSDNWLRKMNKPWTFETIKRGLLLLTKHGIKYHLNLRCCVGETRRDVAESIMNSLDLVEAGIKPTYVKIGQMNPILGTVFGDREKGIKMPLLPEIAAYVKWLQALNLVPPNAQKRSDNIAKNTVPRCAS